MGYSACYNCADSKYPTIKLYKMILDKKYISTLCLIIIYNGACSSTKTIYWEEVKDGCHYEKQLYIIFDYISNNWFTKADLIVLIHTESVKINDFASHLHVLAESNAISLLTVNMNPLHLISNENSKVHATEEDVIVCILQEWDNFFDILESNNVFHLSKQSRVLVFYIQKSANVTKQTQEKMLSPSSGKAVLMLAVVHLRVNMHSKDNQCEYDISVISYNPFSEEYYSTSVTFETFDGAAEILRYAYSRSKTSNLQGHSLRVGTHCVDLSPVFTLNKIEGDIVIRGFLHQGLDEINKRMNYTPEFVVVYDRINFGRKLPNGTWSGIVGDLVTRRIDIGYTPLLKNFERSQVVEYSEHITITHFSIVVPKGKQIPPWMLLMLVFEFKVDLLIFGSFVIMVMAFKVIFIFLKIFQHWNLIVLRTIGVLIGVSITQPSQRLLRTLYITWAYFSLIVSSIYSQSVVSVLTIPRYHSDINTFKQLVDSKLPIKGWSYAQRIFQDKSNPLMWLLYERYKIDFYYSEILRDIKEGEQVAVIHTKNSLDYYVTNARTCPICSDPFHYMGELFGMQMEAIAFAKGSPYVRRINELVRGMHESGLFDKWNLDLLYELELKTACFSDCSVKKVLSVWDLQICFYILLAGIFISLVLFSIEMFFNSFCFCMVVPRVHK